MHWQNFGEWRVVWQVCQGVAVLVGLAFGVFVQVCLVLSVVVPQVAVVAVAVFLPIFPVLVLVIVWLVAR